MNNPLLPGPRRVNWLGKEPEPDLSWWDEELRKFLDSLKMEAQLLKGEMLNLRKARAQVAIREFMLQQDDPTEFIDKDLLKELKDAPVALINPDSILEFYPGYFQEKADHEYEQCCEEDPFWGPMQEASAFGKGHDVRELEEDPNEPFANESDAEYFRRMDLKRMKQRMKQ